MAPRRHRSVASSESGFAMAALLVSLSVMAILMSVVLPNWKTLARREKEAELIFRGEQYARAIALYQRQNGNNYPPNVDVLVTGHFLRKKYKDPITGEDFEIIRPGTEIAGIDPAQLGGAAGRVGIRPAAQGGRGGTRGGRANTQQGGATARGRGETTTRGTGARGGAAQGRGGDRAQQGGRGAAGTTAGATTGVMGVRSTSTEPSLRVYNGAERYDQWLFVATQSTLNAGAGAVGAGAAGEGAEGGEAGGRGGRGRGEAGGGRGRGGRGEATGGRGRGGRGDAGPARGGRGGGRGNNVPGGGGGGRGGRRGR